MPSIFAITPAGNNVRLSKEGRGEFVFTVTNTSTQFIVARARITPQDPKQQSWFTIQDDPQRRYPAKGTEQIRVQVAAPATALPGSYSFHPDVISVDNPDELFTIGPSVSFEVAKPAEKKPMPLWPILAAVAAVVIIGVALWLIFSKKDVPNLVGLTLTAAETQAQSASLKIGQITQQRTGLHVANTVISQTPATGPIPADATLNLTVEQAPFATVPNVVGVDIATAQNTLTTAGLALGTNTNQQTAAGNPNTVLSQNLPAGIQVAPGTPVNLVVKANTIQVPSVVGQSISQAISTITQNHLVANPVASSAKGTAMYVVAQSPAGNAIVAQQTVVNLSYVTGTTGVVAAIPVAVYKTLPASTKFNIQQTKVLPK